MLTALLVVKGVLFAPLWASMYVSEYTASTKVKEVARLMDYNMSVT